MRYSKGNTGTSAKEGNSWTSPVNPTDLRAAGKTTDANAARNVPHAAGKTTDNRTTGGADTAKARDAHGRENPIRNGNGERCASAETRKDNNHNTYRNGNQ